MNSLSRVFASWGNEDPQAAAAAAAGLAKNDRTNAYSSIANAWSQTDPQAALAWAKSLPGKEGRDYAMATVLGQLSQTDGPAAAAALSGLSPSQRTNQVGQIASNWANNDREGAMAWARSLERPQDRANALGACLRAMDFSEMDQINAVLAEIPQGRQRQDTLRGLAENRAWQDPEGTLDWLGTLSDMDRAAALRDNGMSQFAYSNPQRAAELLAKTPGMAEQPYQWSNIAAQMATDDPAGALAWAEALEIPGVRKQSINQVMQSWARENGPEAIAKARTFQDPALQKSALSSAINSWADADPEAVIKWAETATGEERDMGLLRASIKRAGDDPAASAAMVDSLLPANAGEKIPGHFSEAAGSVARDWFAQDIGAATAWAMRLPAGDVQESAVRAITDSWTSLDAVAASQWVQQLPAGPSRDLAAQQLSQGIAQSDPESAFTWAASIGDDSKRDDAVRSAAQSWQHIDRDAALAAVMQAHISENVRTSLLEQLGKAE